MSIASKPLQIKKSSLFPLPPLCRGFLQKYVVAAIDTLNMAGIPFWAYFFGLADKMSKKTLRFLESFT